MLPNCIFTDILNHTDHKTLSTRMNTLQDDKSIQLHHWGHAFFSYVQSVDSSDTRKKEIYIEIKMIVHIYIHGKRTNPEQSRFHEEEEAPTKH